MAKRGRRTTGEPKPENAIRFKVTLRHIRPPIWRRVVLPDHDSLGRLHEVIQIAMGWENCHLHAFRIGNAQYSGASIFGGDPDMDMENENLVLLSEIAGKPKVKFMYEYDFGDSWKHEVLVEKMLPFDPTAKYPLCLNGARACPPEDCGGIPGYLGILDALEAPRKSPEQKERLEWLGENYDPERFDMDAINRRLRTFK